MKAPIVVPPILGVLCAQAVERWRIASERYELATRSLTDAQSAWHRAEKELRELSRAVSIVLHTATPASPVSDGEPDSNREMPTADVLLAWMQAGSPTDSDGNMLWPGMGAT